MAKVLVCVPLSLDMFNLLLLLLLLLPFILHPTNLNANTPKITTWNMTKITLYTLVNITFIVKTPTWAEAITGKIGPSHCWCLWQTFQEIYYYMMRCDCIVTQTYLNKMKKVSEWRWPGKFGIGRLVGLKFSHYGKWVYRLFRVNCFCVSNTSNFSQYEKNVRTLLQFDVFFCNKRIKNFKIWSLHH